MRGNLVRALLAVVACTTFGSFAYAGETKSTGGEKAGAKIDEAADKTADDAKVVGRKVKHTTKKAVKKTGAALDKAGDKIEDATK